MTSTNVQSQQPEKLDRRRLVLFLLADLAFFPLFMFLPAGTWTWDKGWLFILVLVAVSLVASLVLWRVNPEVVVARNNPHQGTKHWDKILLWFPAVFGDLSGGCSGRWAVSLVPDTLVGLCHRLRYVVHRHRGHDLGHGDEQIL
jgi:hypothetical protein